MPFRQTYTLTNIVKVAEPGAQDLELHSELHNLVFKLYNSKPTVFLSQPKSLNSGIKSAFHHIHYIQNIRPIEFALGGGAAPRKLLAPTFPYNVPNINIPNLNFPPLPPTIDLPFLPPTPLWPEYRLPPPITSLPDFPPVLTFPIASPPSITTTTP
ncbi:hypothetical protein ACFX2I_002824 [Malus domestica]